MNDKEVDDDTRISPLQEFFDMIIDKQAKLRARSKSTSAHSGINVEKLFNQKFLSDFSIVCKEGQVISAHKVVLAMGSPVFKRMLEMDCKESADCELKIIDFEFDVVDQMVMFIYTGDAPKMNTMAENLLTIAEKYEILRLKRECEEAIIRTLSVTTALDILYLADMHNAAKLEHATIRFIKIQFSAIRASSNWKLLSKRLLEKLLDSAMNYLPQNELGIGNYFDGA